MAQTVNLGRVVGRDGEKGESGKDGLNGKDGKDGVDGKNGKDGASFKVGSFCLFPFRTNELPDGWYFRGGDNFLLSSPQGQVLNSLSANYKSDHGITIKTINGQQYINVPSGFYPDGRGCFERATNGITTAVGLKESDCIREISGNFLSLGYADGALFTGTKYEYDATGAGSYKGLNLYYVGFSASRVVPVGSENIPVNISLTPAIYLGV